MEMSEGAVSGQRGIFELRLSIKKRRKTQKLDPSGKAAMQKARPEGWEKYDHALGQRKGGGHVESSAPNPLIVRR